ncbi:MAG: hypothetical protein ABIQ04_04980 [Candidatus Saccharimonadales bacterium]
MKKLSLKIITLIITLATVLTPAVHAVSVSESCPKTTDSTACKTSQTQTTTNDQTRLTNLETRGSAEINRRLVSLNTLTSVISGTSKLSTEDKTSLTAEVASTVSGLTDLNTKLSNDSTLSDARTDVQSIITGYRVYALIGPKVRLIASNDNQQVIAEKQLAIIAKIQTALDAKKANTDLEARLISVKAIAKNSTNVSESLKTKLLALQPSDYNSDHSVMSTYRDQLKTNHTSLENSAANLKKIVADLKSL